MSIRDIVERLYDDGYLAKNDNFVEVRKERLDTALTLIKAELVKGMPENKECHHVGEDGFLIDGKYCDKCISYNQSLTEVLTDLTRLFEEDGR